MTAEEIVESRNVGQQATLMQAASDPPPPARGVLRGYFQDAEDVRQYLEEERRGWAEREAELVRLLPHSNPHEDPSNR